MTLRREVQSSRKPHAVPAWWSPLLLEAASPSIFLSQAWLQTWLDVFGEGFDVRWVAWHDGERVVAGCMMLSNVELRKRVLPLRSAYFNATGRTFPTAGFNEVACVPGYESQVADDLGEFLAHESWDQLLLHAYAEGGILDRALQKAPTALVERDGRPAPFVDLIAVAEKGYEASLSSNSRNQIRRSRRLYAERSGTLTVTRAETLEGALAFLDKLATLHNARWEGRGAVGSFGQPGVMEFHTRLVKRLWDLGTVDLLRIAAGDEEIGYLYNFRGGDTIWFFQSGFSYEKDARYKPGLTTHACAIEHYMALGLHEYDFLPGDARYKRSLAKQERMRYWTTVYRDRAWIRALLMARRAVQRRNQSPASPAAPAAEVE